MTATIRLKLFGVVTLIGSNGTELDAIVTQPKRVGVLAYCAMSTRTSYVRRDRLLATFWPELDQTRARVALRKTIHAIRQALGDDALLSRGDEDIVLVPTLVDCDVTHFEQAIDDGRPARALELYRGDLLDGFHLKDAPEFGQWLDERRAHYRRLAATAAWVVARQHEADSETTRAVDAAYLAATFAPLDERVIQKVMAMLDRVGDRAGAVTLYERFRSRLESDLGVVPAPETARLIEAIRNRR